MVEATKECTEGYYCPTSSTSPTQTECPEGSWCVAGSPDHTPCPAGNLCIITLFGHKIVYQNPKALYMDIEHPHK